MVDVFGQSGKSDVRFRYEIFPRDGELLTSFWHGFEKMEAEVDKAGFFYDWMFSDLRKRLYIQKTLEWDSEMVDQLIG